MQNGLKILIVSDAFANLALGMLGPIYAIFVGEIGGDILDVGWAYFSFTFTSGVVLYLISTWEDKVLHKEKLVVGGYAIIALGCFLYFFTDTQLILLVTQAVLGIGVAMASPAFDAMYSHFIDSEKEASEWGAWEAMGYMVAAIAAVLGSLLVDHYGFKYLFIFMFIAAVISTIASFLLFRNKDYLSSSKL